MQAHDSHDRSPDRPGSAVPQLCGNVFSRIDERRTAVLVGVSGCDPRRMVEGLVRCKRLLARSQARGGAGRSRASDPISPHGRFHSL